MKKYILLSSIVAASMFSSCDYNDHNFDNLDELSKPQVLESYDYTFVSDDVAAIVKALRANLNHEDSIMANQMNADKRFSVAAPAATLVPYLLKSKYDGADVGSIVNLTYPYDEMRSELVSALSTSTYVLSDADYKSVWGDVYTNVLTPAKSPEKNIPTILQKNISAAKEGDFANVEYYYSETEPETTTVENNLLTENFEDYASGSGVLVSIDGWINKDLKGSIGWQCRTYSNNNYAQVSSYKSGTENDVRLITKAIDLTKSTNPQLSFDIVVGNYNANCLNIEVSENFDGNEANIALATWFDITGSFTIPEPASGYTTWATAGSYNLKAYAGKKIYVAFKYSGDDRSDAPVKKTTTYQIDNVTVSEKVSGIAVKTKSIQYAAYQYSGDKWSVAPTSVIVLQPADYSSIGVTYLTKENANTHLPTLLKLKFPFANAGDVKQVVYKTSKTANYADEYTYINKEWVLNSFVINKTEQFILTRIDGIKEWIFDPTIVVKMQKGKNDTDDYMMVVNAVKNNQAIDNPKLINSYGDTEYYYGFSANFGNVSYRDKDRSNDPLYPINGTSQEKEDFCNARTIEGIKTFLKVKYPNAQPLVNGVTQKAKITVLIYSSHISNYTNENWTYTLECTGDKEWKCLQRTSEILEKQSEIITE